MQPSVCLDIHAAVACADGAIALRADLEEHLDGCRPCRGQVADRVRARAIVASGVVTISEPRRSADSAGTGVDRRRRARRETSEDLPDTADPAGDDVSWAGGMRVGRYVVLDEIGAGGMGVVLAAYDPELDRQVALKLVQPAGSRTVTACAHALLRREAQAMARLHHPNVVAVHDVGTHEGRTFIAMQLVAGASLDVWLRSGRRGWRSVLAVCRDAGRGLAAAHRAGVTHRDVKPQNILVGDDGVARIADFGLAVAGRIDPGVFAGGTPAYMALEQHRGENDQRSDQFGFCVTTFESLWGVRPFSGRTPDDLARQIAAGDVREVRRGLVPRRILAALIRGLAAEPADRFPSMEALLSELEIADAIPSEAVRGR